MPFRLCPTCGTFIETGAAWNKHRQSHVGRKPNGRYGSTRQWRNIRTQVLNRDANRCCMCGSTYRLQVHHIDGDYRNNELDNLVTVCEGHHVVLEAEKRKAIGSAHD